VRPTQPKTKSYLESSSYASAAEQQYGPATGTIFGSALSAMSQDNGQSLGDIFGTGTGHASPSTLLLPTLLEDHAPIQGISIDLGPSSFAQSNPYPNQIAATSSSNVSINGYTNTYFRALPTAPCTSSSTRLPEWTLPSSSSMAASPARRPFDYPSAGPTPSLIYPSTSPSRAELADSRPRGLSSSSVSSTRPQPHPATQHEIPQIDAVVAWHDVCFFISLHMRHQHGLMPLVHKPTFAQDVLQRRDVGDETFRGLLCSIGKSSYYA
jgi:hypothetical protein